MFNVVEFFKRWDWIVMTAAFAGVWIFGLTNWCRDSYRKQNKQFLSGCRRLLYRGNSMLFVPLPSEYLRQWRACINGKACRPAAVFEFVPHKRKVIFLHLFVLCAVISSCYLVLFFLCANLAYLVFQFAFWLAFAVVLLVNNVLFAKKEKRARQAFGKFVSQLNALADKQNITTPQYPQSEDALDKAAKLLHQNGLEGPRTVQEQKQINKALNGLLQAYALRRRGAPCRRGER